MTQTLRALWLAALALALGACAATKPTPRRALAPATSKVAAPAVSARVYTEAAERLAPRRAPAAAAASNVARPYAVPRAVVVEEVESAPAPPSAAAPAYDVYQGYLERRGRPRRRAPNPFPVNAAVGAGLGAVLGHQAGRRDEGALIGGGIGLLFDLGRWSR